jgi:Amt family ammonium transporter
MSDSPTPGTTGPEAPSPVSVQPRRSFGRRMLDPKRLLASAAVSAAVLVLLANNAFAQDAAPAPLSAADKFVQSTNLLWIVVGAALVMFMQAGFALLETGFVRAKNGAHTMAMNIAVFGTGATGFFVCGYALMFGGYSAKIPGADWGYDHPLGGALVKIGSTTQWVFLWKGGWAMTGGKFAASGAVLGYFLYMLAFMDTAATIPTGSMAERWKFKSFVLWGFFCGALYYPLFGAWTWGGGWLSQLGNSWKLGNGYVDFAGSGVVHAVGGVAALTGALVLGPRLGKYTKDGKSRGLPGHSLALAGAGTLILMFGWFGFNAGSTLQITDGQFGLVAANTAIAAAFGCIAGMFWVWKRTGKPDPGMIMNGLLAGLVAITAPCAFVDPWAAAVIGLIAGLLVVEAVFFVDHKLKIDDPVGAIGVHFVNGIWGVLALGIFASGKYGADALGTGLGWNGTTTHLDSAGSATGVTGILYGGTGWGQLGAQAIGALTIIIVMGGISWGFFKLSNVIFKGIRSTPEDEIAGLDVPEMGVYAYPDFVGTGESFAEDEVQSKVPYGD